MQSTLARISLVLLAALSAFGLFHEHLLPQTYWDPIGLTRFGVYLGVGATVLGLLVWRWPAQVLRVGAGLGLAWAMWWAGPVAPLAVLYFVGSCYAMGRILARKADALQATLLGVAAWMTVLWAVLHFPVNYPWVYGIGFTVPYVFVRPPVVLPKLSARSEACGAALLVLLLGAQLLAALKPEISSDGLGMHLALPAAVAHQHVWPFDHRQEVWSLMPAGADALYTGVFLLGGELAGKLLNFAFLALTAAMLVGAARRWTSPAQAYFAAALFVSTPLVLLVTGSLFVENVWAAFVLGAVLALVRAEYVVSAALAGAAVAVKLIAVAFAGPVIVLIFWNAGSRRWRAVAVAALLSLPPYVFAYAKSGNPIFPFANALFRSPDYYAQANFSDSRFTGGLGVALPYELTFTSEKYIEGQGGSAGFQYLLLLLPAALLARRREQWSILGIAAVGAAIVMVGAPNLRYLYPAMPLASLMIAWTPWAAVAGVALALNLWFLPAAGYYDREFALFRKADVAPYLVAHAPSVLLVDRLNREAPEQPVAFFSDGSVAGLAGRAYTDSWHHETYWKKIREAESPAAIAAELKRLGVRRVVGPTDRRALFDVVQRFQELWLDPEPQGSVGKLTLYTLRDTERDIPKDTRPLGPGTYDDREPRIEFSQAWFHDNQFAESQGGTLTYIDTPGASFHFEFEGRRVTYVFTRASNRGLAEVRIDGKLVRTVNEHSNQTLWRAAEPFEVAPGLHSFDVRVAGRGRAAFVDLDAIVIE